MKPRDLPAPSPADIEIPPRHVHVWAVPLAHCHDPALLLRYEALLSCDERARGERFVFARDRHCHLVSRALVRTVLARCVGASPTDLRFDASPQGKPFLVHPDGGRLSFNLSHTRGFAVLGVTIGRRLGIDVEDSTRPAAMSVASRYFSARETQSLLACPPDRRAERFCALWTLKESHVKATGQGIGAPLDAFSFDLDRVAEIGLRGEPGWLDRPERWWLAQWRPSPAHIASLCTEVENGEVPPSLRFHRAVPLVHEEVVDPPLIRTSRRVPAADR